MKTLQKFYHYSKIVTKDTPYAKNMQKLREGIFGEVPSHISTKSHKVYKILSVEPFDKQGIYANYYPRHVETNALTLKLREYGLYRDEHEDFKEEMLRMRDLRGKNWMKNQKIKHGKLKE